MAGEVSRERALAHESRVALLAALRGSDAPLDVRDLAARVGLHVNTVRSHLATLEDAGLVARRAEPRDRPGRPRQLYTAVAPQAAPEQGSDSAQRYRLMARMLASYIAAHVADPAAAAEETGHEWGRHLAPPRAPFSTPSAEAARSDLVRLLDDLGFAPRPGAAPDELELRNCPFREVAEVHPEIACSLHLGLMRGALAAGDAPLAVRDLQPFVDADRCLTHLDTVPDQDSTTRSTRRLA